MKKVFFILTCFVLMFTLTGNQISTVNAAEQNDDFAITILNESTMRLELLNEDVKIEKDKNGNLIIKKDDYTEVLPTMTLDANGNPIDLIYKSTDNGLIIELHNVMQSRATSKWKCTFGVLGGYYTGALAGLGTGTAVGSVLPGIGNVAGAIGGTIVGAAGGAMTGAAASCF